MATNQLLKNEKYELRLSGQDRTDMQRTGSRVSMVIAGWYS